MPVELKGGAPLIIGLGGTVRAGSTTEMAISVSLRAAREAGAETVQFRGSDLDLPMFSPDKRERTPQAHRLVELLRRSDGIIIGSPSYHGSLSGLVKNALDYAEDLRDEEEVYFDGRAVGCIVCAHGWQATGATLTALRSVVHALRGWPTPMGAGLNTMQPLFDADGRCSDQAALRQLELVGRQVAEFAAIRCTTGAVPLPPPVPESFVPAIGEADPEILALLGPVMRDLHQKTGATVHFSIPLGNRVVTIDGTEPRKASASERVPRGLAAPLHASPASRAVLAHLSDAEIGVYLDANEPLERFTATTLTSPEDVWTDIRATRERGYAISHQDFLAQRVTISFPLLDAAGRPHGALTIGGPVDRFSADGLAALVPLVRAELGAVAERLGAIAARPRQ